MPLPWLSVEFECLNLKSDIALKLSGNRPRYKMTFTNRDRHTCSQTFIKAWFRIYQKVIECRHQNYATSTYIHTCSPL